MSKITLGRNVAEVSAPAAITLSYSRTPAALAADIKRRVLPNLDECWQRNEAAIMKVNAQAEKERNTAAMIKARYGGQKAYGNPRAITFGGATVEMTYDCSKVLALGFRDIPTELALCLMDIYQSARSMEENK